MNKKIIDPEHLSIDQPAKNKSYYLYTGRVLKLVEMSADEFDTKHHPFSTWEGYVNSLPSIEVSEDLKKIWKEGQRVEEGKDFCIQFWTGSSWWPIEHLVDKTAKPGTKLKAFPIAAEPLKPDDQDELWMDAAAIMEQSHLDDENYKETLSALKSKYTITRK